MTSWKRKRNESFNDLIISTYLLSLLCFAIAFIIKYIPSNYNPLRSITICFFLFLAILGFIFLFYIKSTRFGISLLCFIIIDFLIISYNDYIKMLLIIPVILISVFVNKKNGILISFIGGISICIYDYYFFESTNLNQNLESNILFTAIMFITACLVGGIAEIERETRSILFELANRDGLSGVYNHGYFQVCFRSMCKEAEQIKKSLSLVIFDIDYFKHFNDSFGHPAGDEILKGVGEILQNHVKHPSVCARYGGDEFCILLPNHDVKSAYELTQCIKKEIENLNIKNTEKLPARKITITAGVANYPEHTDQANKILKLADQALYKAKYTNKSNIALYFNVLDGLKNFCEKSEKELLNSIKTLLHVINAKDKYTYGHSERVLEYATILATCYGVNINHLRNIQYGAYLHDIGKIEVDITILNSFEKITEHEWNILKQHPYWGSEIIKPIKSLEEVRPFILYHHENYDGTGYPYGISGPEIPLGARIIRIVDSFDAMTTDRPYKKGITPEEACQEILKYADKMYDKELCKLFVEIIKSKPNISLNYKDHYVTSSHH